MNMPAQSSNRNNIFGITIREVLICLISSTLTMLILSASAYFIQTIPNVVWRGLSIASQEPTIFTTLDKPGEIYIFIHRPSNRSTIYYNVAWGGLHFKGYEDCSYHAGIILHLVNISGTQENVTVTTTGQFSKSQVSQTNQISTSPYNHCDIPPSMESLHMAGGKERANTAEKYKFIHL